MLGLAADRVTAVADCLTSEEMAVLVEGKYTRQDEKLFLQHIAHCDKCYQEWLVLGRDRQKKAGKKPNIVSLFTRPKALAVCGSALAIAASIAVIINIDLDHQGISLQNESHVSQQQITIEKEVKMQTAPAPEGAIGRNVHGDVVPQPSEVSRKRAVVQDQQVEEKGFTARKKEDLKEAAKSSMPMSPAVTVAGKRKILSKAMNEKTVVLPVNAEIQSISDWLKQVEKGCLERKQTDGYWQQLAGSGHRIKEKSSSAMKQDEQFVKILDLVVALQKDKLDKNCAEIMQLLKRHENLQEKRIH